MSLDVDDIWNSCSQSCSRWHARVTAAEGVKKGLEDRLKVIAEEEKKAAAGKE